MGVEAAVNHSTLLHTVNRIRASVIPGTALNWVTSAIQVLEKTGLCFRPYQESMDELLEDCSKDAIRQIMLKHERIFKEQVYELHRLYKVQKMLMSELSKQLRLHPVTETISKGFSDTKSSYMSSQSPPFRDKPSCTVQFKPDDAFHSDSSVKAATSSLGLTVDTREVFRLQRGFDLDLHVEESPGRSFVSIEQKSRTNLNDCMHIQTLHPSESEDSDLELTLSIGSGSSMKKSRQRPQSNHEPRPAKSLSLETSQNSGHLVIQEGTSMHNVSLASESLHRPGWLFPTLKPNRS